MIDLPPIQIVEIMKSCVALSEFGVVVKIPPAKTQDEAYSELTLTEQDRTIIYEIIKTIADNGKLTLLFKQNHLKQLGTQINHVHPLKFLSAIFTHPELKICMIDVYDDYFKKTGFLDGLAPSLTREAEKGKLTQYLDDFAADLQVSLDGIKPYFQSGDWEELVRYLIQTNDITAE